VLAIAKQARRDADGVGVIAQRFKQPERAQADHVGGVFGLVERDAHVGLGGKIVNFVGPHLLDDRTQPGAVAQIAVV
jgi:hypothetical protein